MNINNPFSQSCRIAIVTLALIITALIPAQAQWVQTKGPGGGDVISLIEKNNTILAATIGGVFRSTDNGENWSKSWPEGVEYATTFAATANYIYAATYGAGVYRSANNGASWSFVNMNTGLLFILKLFASHDTLYIGCDGGGVYRSVGDATTFQSINAGYPGSAHVTALAQVGQYLYSGLAGTGGTVGMYRTPVAAINWTQINNGLITNPSIIDLAMKGADLLVTTASPFAYGLYRSADLGNTWFNQTPAVLPAAEIPSYLAVSGNDIYVGTAGDAPYKSGNNGASYQRVGNGLKPLTVFSLLAGSGGIFMGFERGIARTTNGAVSWGLKNKGLTNTTVTSFFADGNTLYATAKMRDVGHSEGVFYTTDNGQNWSSLSKGLQPNPQINALVKSDSVLIAGTDNNGLYIRTTSDTAFRRPAGLSNLLQVNCLLNTPLAVLAGTTGDGELYRSTDHGLTWVQSNTGFNNAQSQSDQIYSLYEKNGVVYAGGFNALYKSADYGATWTSAFTGIYPGTNINGITSLGNELYAAASSSSGVYKSINNGASWAAANTGLSPIGSINTITSYNDTLYLGSDLGVFKSINHGASWDSINTGLLFFREALSLLVYNNRLFLGTDQTAAWYMPLSAQSTAVWNAANVSENLLSQNFPNPFATATTISFQIPESAQVSLKVYDASGKEVSVLVDKVLGAGVYKTQWDGAAAPAGIYFYKLIAGNKTGVKSMQLIK